MNQVIKMLKNSGMDIRFGSIKRENSYGRTETLSTISILKKTGKDIHRILGKGQVNIEKLKMKIVRDKTFDKEVVSLCLTSGGMNPLMIKLGINRNYGVGY